MKLTKDNIEKLALIDEIRSAVKETVREKNLVYHQGIIDNHDQIVFIYENGLDKIADDVIEKTSLFETKEKERIIERDKWGKVKV